MATHLHIKAKMKLEFLLMIFSRPFFWGCVQSLGEKKKGGGGSAEEEYQGESQSCALAAKLIMNSICLKLIMHASKSAKLKYDMLLWKRKPFNGAHEVAVITDINHDVIPASFVLLGRMKADQ